MSHHSRVALYLGASALALATAGAAYAQGGGETVIITGTLLGTANFTAPSPVTQVTAEDVETRSLSGIGTLISELPTSSPGGGLTTTGSGIVSVGQSTTSIHGSGTVLALIDGIRPTSPQANGSFDNNMIPSALVDHFDIVTAGASATYGSDAVGGVINFILKKRMNGWNASTYFGTSQYGDNNQFGASVAWGSDFAGGKGHFIIGGETAGEWRMATIYSRPWGRLEPGPIALTSTRPAGFPATYYTNHAEFNHSTPGGLITGCTTSLATSATVNSTKNCALYGTAFDFEGNPYKFEFGTLNGNTFMLSTSNYGVSDQNRYLGPPYWRSAGMARAEYEIMPGLTGFITASIGQLESDRPPGPIPFPQSVLIASGNPYIPATVQAAMTANNIYSIRLVKTSGTNDYISSTRYPHAGNKNNLVQLFAGLDGTVFDDWNWSVKGTAGRAMFHQVFVGVVIDSNLLAASHVVKDANGIPVCGDQALRNALYATAPYVIDPPQWHIPQTASETAIRNYAVGTNNPNYVAISDAPSGGSPTNPNSSNRAIMISKQYPGCLPFNMFGIHGDPQGGALWNYLENPTDGNAGSKNNGRHYGAQFLINGSPYELPAGALQIALGAEWRWDSFNQLGTPPGMVSRFNTRNIPTFYTSDSVYEFNAEIGVPVVRDLPFAQAIDFNAAARYTHYGISGSVWTWKYGATWDVTEWARLRATLSTDIRAPNFGETANSPSSGQSTILNTQSLISQQVTGILTNGNPNLLPEIAHGFYAGIVLTPDLGEWLPGFRFSLDYYRLNNTGVIASIGGGEIVSRCLGAPHDIPPSPAFPEYCTYIEFRPGEDPLTQFAIQHISTTRFNLNSEVVNGLDFNIRNRVPIDLIGIPGTLSLSTAANYAIDDVTSQPLPNGTTQINHGVGGSGLPRWSLNMTATYALERWKFSANWRYWPPIKAGGIGPEDPFYDPTKSGTTNIGIWPSPQRMNFAVAYDIIQGEDGENLNIYLNVDNALDGEVPAIWWNAGIYDPVGRYFKLGLRYDLPE